MHRRIRTLVAAFGAVAALLGGAVIAAPHADARPVVRDTARTINQVIAGTTKADDSSINWGGYYVNAAPNQPISQASTLVVTPKPKALPPTLSASWVGIGGAKTSDLIQAGVAYGATDGYYAWYELLPAGLVPITSGCSTGSCPVTFDDQIAVDIQNVGPDAWNIAITNVGKWSWSQTFNYASSMSSAEWIYEAPMTTYAGIVPVYGVPARFDHANFYANNYVMGGVGRSLAAADATRSNVSPVGILNLATPSPIRGDSAFAVCPYKQTCPTP